MHAAWMLVSARNHQHLVGCVDVRVPYVLMLQDHSISGPWGFLVKEEVQCLCEGGRNCAHENPARQKAANAIAGLHSSWVGDEVLAMARPWQENVLKHDVVSQFKQQNIGMILNLQEVRSWPIAAAACTPHKHSLLLALPLAAAQSTCCCR